MTFGRTSALFNLKNEFKEARNTTFFGTLVIGLFALSRKYFRIRKVNDNELKPYLKERDWVLEVATKSSNIRSGDLVTLISPVDGALITRRVLGTAGDVVNTARPIEFYSPLNTVKLQKNTFWIETESFDFDSKHFGPIIGETIRYKVLLKFYPEFEFLKSFTKSKETQIHLCDK